MFEKLKLPLVGAIAGIISIVLVQCGNPANMGFCIACFLRDIAGGLGLHSSQNLQYIRPEIIGILIGAFIAAIATKEWKPKGASAPLTRFVLGACVMIGALLFLGCPLRMALRIAGGDMNAVIGFVGFIAGIGAGIFFLRKGFSLKQTYAIAKTDGMILPIVCTLLFMTLMFFPALLSLSTAGPGALRAPIFVALGAGLIMGGLGYITRICFSGGIRDMFLFKSFGMFSALLVLIVVVFIGNIITGAFNFGFEGQPVAHTEWLWNFFGLFLVGFGSILLSGCPFRQLVLAGSGNTDSTITVFGMIFGAAIAHNFGTAASGAGVTTNGKVGFIVAVVIMLGIAVYNTFFDKAKGSDGLLANSTR